jgi:hypothetical protein
MELIQMTAANSQHVSILRPYNGSHHILPDGCPKVLSTFPGDMSSRINYSFNSLGFRGEEFQIAAARHVFICGDSVTLGLGLDYASAWVSRFRRGYATMHDSQESCINLQNFSSSGCSNGYIARTLIGQCGRFRPTLALALLTFPDRAEILHNGRSYNIGPWCLLDTFDGGAQADGHYPELRQMIRRKAKAYYELNDKLLAGQNLLTYALLLQLFFQVHDIPFLIGFAEPDASGLLDDPLLAPWIESLDPRRVFTIPKHDYRLDESAVPGHPGPAGSQAIAEHFLSRYKDIYGRGWLNGMEGQTESAGLADPAQTSENPGVAVSSWRKGLDAKLKNSANDDSNVYPLY